MSKYAHIEESGKLIGWYDDTIHGTIPTPNIKVDDQIWELAINENANFYDGDKFIVKDLRTHEEIKKDKLNRSKNEGEIYTLNDVDYKVSFTKDDAIGLLQIKVFFELGNTKTNIAFANGTLMPIKATEFLDFAKWFAQKRNSFFEDRV